LARLSHYEKILVLVFFLSLPLINPWVRGDGVGYYAFCRALLIQHNLDLRQDWLRANTSFRMGRIDAEGNILPTEYTPTGHLDNHFSIGPGILWSPFLLAAHLGVLLYDALGGHVPADGFSKPYIGSIALGTALYGFLSLWISFRLSRKYLPERWAFLATLGIWFATSLPVYMYFNPSWSHPLSAFAVALFLWYWDRTRDERWWSEWVILGAVGGLMMDVYPPNAILLIFPGLESLKVYRQKLVQHDLKSFGREFLRNVAFAIMAFAAFLPTLITKKIIYGSYLNFGYSEHWFLSSPAILKVCFSTDHGLFSWTPITLPAVTGLWLLRKRDGILGLYSIIAFAAFLYVIGCYEDWDGLSSFGNRFFVSLTVLFVLGLAGFVDYLARAWNERRTWLLAQAAIIVLILWNFGLIFQWGTHLLPTRGPISWREAAYNQVTVVPVQMAGTLKRYLTRRGQLMDNIEQQDVRKLKSHQGDSSE
jgi:Dolichyl-phosphate-mannose-protein mannosyltransferase